MYWLGKIIGGFLGFKFYGPFGLFLGAALGHAVDEETKLRRKAREINKLSAIQRQLQPAKDFHDFDFLVPVFSMLAKIARADGSVNEREIIEVEAFISAIKLDAESKRLAQTIFRDAKHSGDGFALYLGRFYAKYRTEPALLIDVMEVMIRVAAVDGNPSESERRLLEQAAYGLHVEKAIFRKLCRRYFPEEIPHYGELGCSPGASVEQIKKRYRELVSKYHPDKLVSKKLSDSEIKRFQEKFRKIQEAYEAIRTERGFA